MDGRGRALVSAALRHVRDAEHLLADSPDQSWHLAGFGPECIRKACLAGDWVHKALGHDWNRDAEVLLEWAIAISPEANRYGLSGWGQRYAPLDKWTPEHRYQPTGKAKVPETQKLVKVCRQSLDRTVAHLWADGILEDVEV